MPAIFDFDCTLTKSHTFQSYAIEIKKNLSKEECYDEGQRAAMHNIKEGVQAVLMHDSQNLSAVATFHNNPEFVAGNISAILKKELTLVDTVRKKIKTAHPIKTEIAINVYKVEGVEKPFLISYIPFEGKDFSLAINILSHKNAQINAIRDYWVQNGSIKETDVIDFYEDTEKNYEAARALDYINGHLVSQSTSVHKVIASYKAVSMTSNPCSHSEGHREGESDKAVNKTSLIMINNEAHVVSESCKSVNNTCNVGMMVLSGFIAALGIAAIAIAFTALNASTLGISGLVLAGAGIATCLTGCGLFAKNIFKKEQSSSHSDSVVHELNVNPV